MVGSEDAAAKGVACKRIFCWGWPFCGDVVDRASEAALGVEHPIIPTG